MTAFGQYEDDDSASTLKQRDHKDATDLVVSPAVTSKWAKGSGGPAGDEVQNLVAQAWGMYGPSGQEGAALEEQPAITASHGQPGNVGVPTPKMLFVRGGVEVDRHGKKAGKGPLLTDDESATLDAGNHWTLFQPQAFDEMNFSTDDQHHVLRAGTKQSTGVVEQIAFRKAARAQSSEDSESWVNDGLANTVNTFDVGDSRTTHAIVEPPSYGVRRLTPVECERLQAFPDGWTEPAGSDSARYKAMGNAVTVNTVRWILGRMLEQS